MADNFKDGKKYVERGEAKNFTNVYNDRLAHYKEASAKAQEIAHQFAIYKAYLDNLDLNKFSEQRPKLSEACIAINKTGDEIIKKANELAKISKHLN